MSWPRIRLLFRNMEDTDAVVDACTELVVCSLGASTMLAAKEKRKHSTWVKQSIRDRQRMVRTALCFQNWKPMIWVDTYSIWGWTSVRSRNNKISNENPASTGSLAVSKRFFFLHSVCLSFARTKEPAANLVISPVTCVTWPRNSTSLLQQSRHVETEGLRVRLTPGPLQATLSKLLTYCVLRPTKPPALSGAGNE